MSSKKPMKMVNSTSFGNRWHGVKPNTRRIKTKTRTKK